MSIKGSESDEDEINDIEITLMTLRKPTELKKVIDSVPKPSRAVPKNGLPVWYKLGLENKLPVPKMPKGKITFSRGKIGEDFRRLGLGQGPQPNFDLTDPYCHNVSYDYVPMHDPHLTFFFNQPSARSRMKELGFCTSDDRAVCSLKEFNQYRKYLYNRFMDRIHMVMCKLDERAKDDLTLKKVDRDVARRHQIYLTDKKAREHLEKAAKDFKHEMLAKKRAAKEHEKKIEQRMQYLAEFTRKQRQELAAKATEKENTIKQRVKMAAELELRRKIGMVRQWRVNEKKRLNRLNADREAFKKRKEEEANEKWQARVDAQNAKIQEEALLLKLYTDDMTAAANNRIKKAEIYAFNTDLELARIRLANLKAISDGPAKIDKLIRKVGVEFEKSKRGFRGMSPEIAQELAIEAMSTAFSNKGDSLMTLGQARVRMDRSTVLPSAPVKLLEEALENAIREFARRRVHHLMQNVTRVVHERAFNVFISSFKSIPIKKQRTGPRYTMADLVDFDKKSEKAPGHQLSFGITTYVPYTSDDELEGKLKSVKHRIPTRMPTLSKLVDMTFSDRLEDLPDPVATAMPERKKLIGMVHIAGRYLFKILSLQVEKAMDLNTYKVTMPCVRHPMEWGEAVEALVAVVLDNRIQSDNPDIQRAGECLGQNILKNLSREMKQEKKRMGPLAFIAAETNMANIFKPKLTAEQEEQLNNTEEDQ